MYQKWIESGLKVPQKNNQEEDTMESKNGNCTGIPSDREVLKEEIVALIDSMEIEKVRMLYLTAKIWEFNSNK